MSWLIAVPAALWAGTKPLRAKSTSEHNVSEISALFAKFVTFSEKKEWNKA